MLSQPYIHHHYLWKSLPWLREERKSLPRVLAGSHFTQELGDMEELQSSIGLSFVRVETIHIPGTSSDECNFGIRFERLHHYATHITRAVDLCWPQ